MTEVKFSVFFMLFVVLVSIGHTQEAVDETGKAADKKIQVIGGERYSNKWPFHVSVTSYKKNSDGSKSPYKCGGTLISKQWVLTAAHCVFKDELLTEMYDKRDIEVGIGGVDREAPSEKIKVNNIFVRYDKECALNSNCLQDDELRVLPNNLVDNDFAILELYETPKSSTCYGLLPLQKTDSEDADFSKFNQLVSIAGWGVTNIQTLPHCERKSERILRALDLEIIEKERCNSLILENNKILNKLNNDCVKSDTYVIRSALYEVLKNYNYGIIESFTFMESDEAKKKLDDFVDNFISSVIKKNTSQLTDNMICAYRPGKSACNGDSGGALVANIKGQRKQIGIVSGGGPLCADPANLNIPAPGVYTRVAQHYDWISMKIGHAPDGGLDFSEGCRVDKEDGMVTR